MFRAYHVVYMMIFQGKWLYGSLRLALLCVCMGTVSLAKWKRVRYERPGFDSRIRRPGFHALGWQTWVPFPGLADLGSIPWVGRPGFHSLGWQTWVPFPGLADLGSIPWVGRPGFHSLGWQTWVPFPGLADLGSIPGIGRPGFHSLGRQTWVPFPGSADLGSIPAFVVGHFPGRIIPVTLKSVLRWLPRQALSLLGQLCGGWPDVIVL